MGKRIERLTAVQVKAAKPKPSGQSKIYNDGGGLFLRVSLSKSGEITKSWIFKYSAPERKPNGRHYEPSLGLGNTDTVSLAEVRQKARDADRQRRKAWENWKPGDPRPADDPVERKRLVRVARNTVAHSPDGRRTFDRKADDWLDSVSHRWKNPWTRKHCINGLRAYVSPHFGTKDVNEITVDDVLSCLEPIWWRIPKTATTLRQQIEAVFDYAGRHDDNPARKVCIKHKLPRHNKARTVEHHKAMAYQEIPVFMAELRGYKTIESAALQFVILTAARCAEVLGNTPGQVAHLTWPELNLPAKLWTVPAHRMKMGQEHRVPLSDAAMEILCGMAKWCDEVFPISYSAVYNFFRDELRPGSGFTLHGFRSTFTDWAEDCTPFHGEVLDLALAHKINRTRGAYRRGDALAQRRELMGLWGAYCCGASLDNVAPFSSHIFASESSRMQKDVIAKNEFEKSAPRSQARLSKPIADSI